MADSSSSQAFPEATASHLRPFSVDSSLIPSVDSLDELRELGVSVYAQEAFEKGVIEQVDKALAEQEALLRKKRLRRDVKEVLDQIRAVQLELTQQSKVCQTLSSQLVLPPEQKQQLASAREQQARKLSELKELQTKEKMLLKALEGGETDDNSIAEGNSIVGGLTSELPTSDREQLIQCGEMTPFGTALSSVVSQFSTSKNSTVEEISVKSKPGQSDGVAASARIKKHSSEKVANQIQQDDGDGDYIPSTSECSQSFYSSGSEGDKSDYEPHAKRRCPFLERARERERDRYQPRELSDNDDDEEDKKPRRRLRRTTVGASCQDDGDEELYKKRLVRYEKKKKKQLQQNQQQLGFVEADTVNTYDSDSSESDGWASLDCLNEEDMLLEGGLRVPGPIWAKLYKYQKTGVKWLWELHSQQCGGILGDEMGLGKTIQVVAFLAGLLCGKVGTRASRHVGLGPILIVCPATVLHQWVREFHTWWPMFRVAILHNTGSHLGPREDLVKRIALHPGVLVTTYSTVRIFRDCLLQQAWDYIILDEGHIIRNPNAEVTLVCKQFRTPHRLILSGSPMQNNLRELWSLFDFIFPGKLGTLPVFMEQFSVPITMGGYANASTVQVQTAYRCACVLRDTIGPYLLRRMKADLQMSLQLPSKNEQVLFCQLTPEQISQYRTFLKSDEVEKAIGGKRELQIFPALMMLRKICNHPDLASPEFYDLGGDTEGSSDAPKISNRIAVLQSVAECSEKDYGFWKRSGKLIVVDSLLKLWKQENHRALLFTQTRQMLNIIEKYVQLKGYKYVRMDGATPIGLRQPLVKKFNQDSTLFLFLLTTRVGGLGINLVGANRLIIFDPDWNPSTDIQARERAWRIGQHRSVTVYRLLTSGTIEEKIYHRQIFKHYLTNKVLKDPRQRRFFKQNDLYELFTLSVTDESEGTETSAIFSGTGSDVVVSAVKQRREPRKRTEKKEDRNKVLEMIRRISQSLGKGGDTNSQPVEEERHKVKDKRKKRKKAGATVEGSLINGLDRADEYKPDGTDSVKQQKSSNEQIKSHDDYILHKLFKRSGLHSALHHDTIMDASSVDHVLVESDANRVAQEAARALRHSRRQCLAIAAAQGHVGTPTWTGNAGVAGGPGSIVKPRFGAKRKSIPVGNLDHVSIERGSLEVDANSMQCSVGGASAPSSADLLEQMRSRNAPLEDVLNPPRPDRAEANRVRSLATNEYDSLIDEIRSFVAFQCHVDGQASTQEILTNFAPKLKSKDSSVFRSMLRQICDFERDDTGSGVWRLKPEYK